ncbi:hypothetical protein GPROT2_01327 [Gammaproteobacteria bacterium]|nr:DUF2934 domain-containing protein [Gammaproteobacteria bacterium]QOJ32282.1 MAG: DUF2934 domain-containing protein [Gammaproteobacteria bacterium]CAG0941477.1 hypothetical protein GPROT2_01327 [Gammaproteobacteria bacterium]
MIQEGQAVVAPPERLVGARKDVSVKRTVLAGTKKQAMAGEDRHRLIAEAAYFRAEQRGFVPGCELEDWLAAELEICALLDADDDARA